LNKKKRQTKGSSIGSVTVVEVPEPQKLHRWLCHWISPLISRCRIGEGERELSRPNFLKMVKNAGRVEPVPWAFGGLLHHSLNAAAAGPRETFLVSRPTQPYGREAQLLPTRPAGRKLGKSRSCPPNMHVLTADAGLDPNDLRNIAN